MLVPIKYLIIIFFLLLSCSKEEKKISVIEEKNLDLQMIQAYNEGLKELEKGDAIFNQIAEIVLPYYSDRMCRFICNIPERYLKNRKIQIEYIIFV